MKYVNCKTHDNKTHYAISALVGKDLRKRLDCDKIDKIILQLKKSHVCQGKQLKLRPHSPFGSQGAECSYCSYSLGSLIKKLIRSTLKELIKGGDLKRLWVILKLLPLPFAYVFGEGYFFI